MLLRALLFCLLLCSAPLHARQLVLVQGYLGDISSWRDSGITRLLNGEGWLFAGEYHSGSHGVGLFRRGGPLAPQQIDGVDSYFLVSLPTEAPIVHQAYLLNAYLEDLRQRYPGQSLVLAGHSAGGIVARYVMVRNPGLAVDQLVTIASPNLGTDLAKYGKLAGDSPLALVAPFVGAKTLNRSQGLYSDLLPEAPRRFLHWLNRQPHPQAQYISLVREWQSPGSGDLVVDERSQYLENVAALRGRATSFIVPGSHALGMRDGRLLLDLVTTRNVPLVAPAERQAGPAR